MYEFYYFNCPIGPMAQVVASVKGSIPGAA